jgi:hypothetical protein
MKKELSQKQQKIAQAAEPRDQITGDDFAVLKRGMAEGGEVFEPKGQKPIQVKKQLSRIR